MEFSLLCTRFNLLVLLLAVSSPCNFIQSPMDFGPLNLLQTTPKSSLDFGRFVFNTPSAVLRPHTPQDISLLLTSLSSSSSSSSPSPSSPFSRVTVAARGAGHSIHGQAQALDGIVVEMDSLPSSIEIHEDCGCFYADVSGGALWIELLEESLKAGLTPRSWTDYLYLTVGGTLSHAGISGQSFKYGPQISNVLQLDVVTGNGELVTCSPTKSSDLFYAVLGGLGQFGIITRARILLQKAPQKVRWVRAFYDDFQTFTEDQELLISMPEMIDYVEGFIVLNEQSLHSSPASFPSLPAFISELRNDSTSKVYYCIEFAVHDHQLKGTNVDQIVEEIGSRMRYIPSLMYSAEVSYFDFLNRVTMEEMSLRKQGLWDIPHPWLNLFVPKSGINKFKDLFLDNISPKDFEGPVLIYPLLRDKWNANSSAVLPEASTSDLVVYVVGILRSANPNTCSSDCLCNVLRSHRHIAETAGRPHIGAKQYLGHHPSPAHWKAHFGSKWAQFAARKTRFDPLRILSPGQGIFPRGDSYSPNSDTASYSV